MAQQRTRRRTAAIRIAGAIAFGLASALGVYLLIEAVNPSGLISFTFLLVLPAAVTAFVTYVGDPFAERSRVFYVLNVPSFLLGAVIAASALFLREGVICIVMLAPFWFGVSALGGYLTWRLRKRREPVENVFRASTLLLLPLVSMQVEPMIPLARDSGSVMRSIVIDTDAATIRSSLYAKLFFVAKALKALVELGKLAARIVQAMNAGPSGVSFGIDFQA